LGSASLFSFRSADRLFYGLLAFPSASGSWQKEEGWLLLCDLVEAGVDGEEICWSDRRLQLSSLLSPAAAGAAVEMGEVAGSVEAEERMVSSPGGSSGGWGSLLVEETLLLAGWSGQQLWGGAEAGLCLCCLRGKVWSWRGTAGIEMRGVGLWWPREGPLVSLPREGQWLFERKPAEGRGSSVCRRKGALGSIESKMGLRGGCSACFFKAKGGLLQKQKSQAKGEGLRPTAQMAEGDGRVCPWLGEGV
jgi:hypothetical protein